MSLLYTDRRAVRSGDRVGFKARGRYVRGVVIKVGRKYVHVRADAPDNNRWECDPDQLERLAAA